MNIKRYILIFLFALFLSCNTEAQNIDRIRVKCRPPNQNTYGFILAAATGDLIHTPCTGRASIFNGNVDFSNATVTGLVSGNVSGTGTTNFIPRWTNGAGGVIGDTPFSWDATNYVWNNTALTGTWLMNFKPSALGAGTFTLGNATTLLSLDEATTSISNQVNNATGVWNVTDATNFSLIFNANTNSIIANNTTGGNSLEFDSTAGTGFFKVGDYTATPTNFIELDQTTGIINLTAVAAINANSGAGTAAIGDVLGNFNNSLIALDDTAQTIDITADNITLNTDGQGTVIVGDVGGTQVWVDSLTNTIEVNSQTEVKVGDTAGGNGTMLSITDGSNTYTFNNTAATGTFDLAEIWNYILFRTLTAAGTTGAQVINRPNGTVNFAAGATSLVVTNSQAGTTSTVNAMAQTNDATCSVKNVVPAAGAFTINMTAACTAETAVAFWVYN